MKIHRPLTLVLALTFFLTGCRQFTSQRRADFAPFAEQTIASVSQLDSNLSRRRYLLTARYMIEQSDYLEENLRPLIVRLNSIKTHMVEYSIVVGRLTRPGKTEEEQIAELTDYMRAMRPNLESQDSEDEFISPEELDEIIADVAEQETTLEALQAAQPMINNAALVAARATQRMREYIQELEEVVTGRIDADFAGLSGFEDDYMVQRDLLLGALEEIYRHRGGDTEAMGRLLASGAIPEQHLGTLDLEAPLGDVALEDHLLERFNRLKQVADALWPELEQYQALHAEWDEMTSSFDGELRQTWGVIFVWTRAHDRLARGIVDPAEWFDLSDAPAALFQIAQRTVL